MRTAVNLVFPQIRPVFQVVTDGGVDTDQGSMGLITVPQVMRAVPDPNQSHQRLPLRPTGGGHGLK